MGIYTKSEIRTILEIVSPENKEKVEFYLCQEQYSMAEEILWEELLKTVPSRGDRIKLNSLRQGYFVGSLANNVEEFLEKIAGSEEEKRRRLNLYNSYLSVSSFAPFKI